MQRLGKQMGLRLIAALSLLALIGLAGGCGGSQSRYAPLFVNQTFYLCCNLYYTGAEFSDANYQSAGTFIPLGTPVTVTSLSDERVVFVDQTSQKRYTWIKRYAHVPLASLLRVWFLKENPKKTLENFDAATQSLIQSGKIDVGMTKQQVIMSLGFPPAHKTPDTSADAWAYWTRAMYWVRFQNGLVDKIIK